jgi:hypothetical protein
MLWILANASLPLEPGGINYKFTGLPPDAVVFRVDRDFSVQQQRWTYFDLPSGQWRESDGVIPHGRENFLCRDCQQFLPDGLRAEGSLLISLPPAIRPMLHEAFFAACREGNCSPTLLIGSTGTVIVAGQASAPQHGDE